MAERGSNTALWLVLGGGGLVVVFGLLGCLGFCAFTFWRTGQNIKEAVAEQAKLDEQEMKNPTRVSAEELTRELKDHEASFSKKYQGKWLEVDGTLINIKPVGEKAGVILTGIDDAIVECYVVDAGALTDLQPGRPIRVRGFCEGRGFFDAVILRKCIIVP